MPVPESILKKRKRDEEWAAKRAADAAAKKDHRKQSRKDVFKRAEAYAAEYRTQVRNLKVDGPRNAGLLHD